jgi:hypothetical protein
MKLTKKVRQLAMRVCEDNVVVVGREARRVELDAGSLDR